MALSDKVVKELEIVAKQFSAFLFGRLNLVSLIIQSALPRRRLLNERFEDSFQVRARAGGQRDKDPIRVTVVLVLGKLSGKACMRSTGTGDDNARGYARCLLIMTRFV